MQKQNILTMLTTEAQQEINSLVKSQKNAVNMLFDNLANGNYDYSQISNRLQAQFFALSPRFESLQANNKNGWWQNEEYEPNTVASKIYPLFVDQNGASKFSSFALQELATKNTLRYPLVDDYAFGFSAFKNTQATDNKFNEFTQLLNNKLGVTVAGDYANGYVRTKNGIIQKAILKVKNIALKLLKKEQQKEPIFSGKITLAKKMASGYRPTHIEKTIKIYDSLLGAGVNSVLKNLKKQQMPKLSKELLFASRLFANMLMCRVHDFGDESANLKTEKCLSLQFANVINKMQFNSQQLKLITLLGVRAASELCESMGLSSQDVAEKLVKNGFSFSSEPTSIKEAFILAKESNINKYLEALAGNQVIYVGEAEEVVHDNSETENQQELIEKLRDVLIKKIQNNSDEEQKNEVIQKLVSILNVPLLTEASQKTIQAEQKTQQQKLIDLLNQKLLTSGANDGEASSELIKKLITALNEKQKRMQGERSKIVNSVLNINNVPLLEAKKEKVLPKPWLDKMAQAQRLLAPSQQELERLNANLNNTENNENELQDQEQQELTKRTLQQNLVDILSNVVETKKQETVNNEDISTQEILPKRLVSKKQILEIIDEQIIKLLTAKSIKINDALNSHRFKSIGGKQVGVNLSAITTNLLAYYQNAVYGRKSVNTKSLKNTETIYAKARQICAVLIGMKGELCEKLLAEQQTTKRNENERTKTYVNRLFKKIATTKADQENLSIRSYFDKYITQLTLMYAQCEITDKIV